MFPIIQTILGTAKGTGLLKQATYYCLTDAHNIYTYLNTIIDLMISKPLSSACYLSVIFR